MKALSEKYTELSANYNKKSADLVREIMKIVASYLPVFEESHELIAELDVYTR
jgi:DNA mismatch repair protein MSH2